MKTTKKSYVLGNPDIQILYNIIECFFDNKKIERIEGLEISKLRVSKNLIDNFNNLLPDLMIYYNNWQLRNTFEDLNFIKCIKILKHFLYYFGFSLERKDTLIHNHYKLQKIVLYKVPYNVKKEIESKGNSIFKVCFD